MGVCLAFNPLRATFFRENTNIYLHFISLLHTNKTQVVEIPPRVRQGLFYIINIMAADVLATQGARASATMILTYLKRVNSVPKRKGLTHPGMADNVLYTFVYSLNDCPGRCQTK